MEKNDLLIVLMDLRNQFLKEELEAAFLKANMRSFANQVVILNEMKVFLDELQQKELDEKDKESLKELKNFLSEKTSDLSTIIKILKDHPLDL